MVNLVNPNLSFFLIPSRSSNMPFYPQSARTREHAPNPYFFIVNFKLKFESIKELGSTSWVQALWLGTKNTIKGKVVASPKSGLGWILWVRVCPWVIHAQKMLQLRTNQLVIWFVQVCVSNWLACHYSSPHLKARPYPSTPKMLRTRERVPTPYPFVVFTLWIHSWIHQGVWGCVKEPSYIYV